MNILIIGNLGYIGPVVVNHFNQQNPKPSLYGYDIGYFTGNETVKNGLLPETGLKAQYYGDVRDFDTSLLKNMDAVIYLAAISNDPMGNAFEKPTLEINQACAVKIAAAAKKESVKSFVFASSCSVYGLADSSARKEESELNPLTAYARSKVGAEKDLQPLADANFKITCLRFATACGFSSRLRLDLVLNDFVACALVNKKIEILSDGKPWRPLINVKDMARAMDWAVNRKETTSYLIVNVGSDEWNYQVIDLANAVKKVMPEIEIQVNPNAQPDNRSYKVDFSLFKKLAPEYTPRCTLEETIGELKSGLDKSGFNDPDFRQSHLIRLITLKSLLGSAQIDSDLRRVTKNI